MFPRRSWFSFGDHLRPIANSRKRLRDSQDSSTENFDTIQEKNKTIKTTADTDDTENSHKKNKTTEIKTAPNEKQNKNKVNETCDQQKRHYRTLKKNKPVLLNGVAKSNQYALNTCIRKCEGLRNGLKKHLLTMLSYNERPAFLNHVKREDEKHWYSTLCLALDSKNMVELIQECVKYKFSCSEWITFPDENQNILRHHLTKVYQPVVKGRQTLISEAGKRDLVDYCIDKGYDFSWLIKTLPDVVKNKQKQNQKPINFSTQLPDSLPIPEHQDQDPGCNKKTTKKTNCRTIKTKKEKEREKKKEKQKETGGEREGKEGKEKKEEKERDQTPKEKKTKCKKTKKQKCLALSQTDLKNGREKRQQRRQNMFNNKINDIHNKQASKEIRDSNSIIISNTIDNKIQNVFCKTRTSESNNNCCLILNGDILANNNNSSNDDNNLNEINESNNNDCNNTGTNNNNVNQLPNYSLRPTMASHNVLMYFMNMTPRELDTFASEWSNFYAFLSKRHNDNKVGYDDRLQEQKEENVEIKCPLSPLSPIISSWHGFDIPELPA